MTRICFLDTETTSLRHDRRVWEIGLIVREPTRPEREYQWFIDAADLDLGNADLMSLNIGRFFERHPQHAGLAGRVPGEAGVLADVEKLTRGAHIVGAVPNFDTEVLGSRMRAHGICPSWHYHLCDIENLAAGWLNRHAAVLENRESTIEEAARLREVARPPWKSDELAAALGVTISEEDRHTALGDARWARDIYDAVMGDRP